MTPNKNPWGGKSSSVVWTPRHPDDKNNVLFLDGHVDGMGPDAFTDDLYLDLD